MLDLRGPRQRQRAAMLAIGLFGMGRSMSAQDVSGRSAPQLVGTYQLELITVPGPYTGKKPKRQTMLLVLGTDTVAFSTVRGDRTYFHGSPPNACMAAAPTGEPFRWATVGSWAFGRGDTTRILVERSPDDQTEVILVTHGDTVTGREVHAGGYPRYTGDLAVGRGRRVGDADPARCLQIQNAHLGD